MSLTTRDRHKLAEHLERQGFRTKRTKAGYIAYIGSSTVGWHVSASSPRNEKNLRRDIERLGATWPFTKAGAT